MVLHVYVQECSYVYSPPRFFCGAPDQPGWVQHFIYIHNCNDSGYCTIKYDEQLGVDCLLVRDRLTVQAP